MSYTTVYLIQLDGAITELKDLPNSHGFGPFVWCAISEKYLGDRLAWSNIDEDEDKLSAFAYGKQVPRAWRAALLITYDQVVIEKVRFREIADLIRQFVMDVGIRGKVCHLPGIAELLEQHAEGDVQGMCFYVTSLVGNPWFDYDDKTNESIQYDIKTGTRHIFVGESLEKA